MQIEPVSDKMIIPLEGLKRKNHQHKTIIQNIQNLEN